MKKKTLLSLLSVLSIVTILAITTTRTNQQVVAEEVDKKEQVSEDLKQQTQEVTEINPTVAQAVERAKEDPEFWESFNDFDESETILAVDGGFLKGEMEDGKTNTVYNSDTDPKAATLGEIREAIAEYMN